MTKQLDAKGNQFEVMYFGTYKNAKIFKTNMILYNEESKIKFEIELGQARAVDPLLEQALHEIENNWKKETTVSFDVGSLIFAKIKGYPGNIIIIFLDPIYCCKFL